MKRNVIWMAAALLALTGCQTDGSLKSPQSARPVAAPPADAAASTAPTRPGSPDHPMFPELAAFEPGRLPGACMTESELHADQFIRLHTAMMVAGLTCNVSFSDDNVFAHYQSFTITHQSMIRSSQRVLANYLGRHGSGNRHRLFDTYRTEVANDESQLVIDVSSGRYCEALRAKFYAAAEFSPADLNSHLEEAVARYRESYNVCAS